MEQGFAIHYTVVILIRSPQDNIGNYQGPTITIVKFRVKGVKA